MNICIEEGCRQQTQGKSLRCEYHKAKRNNYLHVLNQQKLRKIDRVSLELDKIKSKKKYKSNVTDAEQREINRKVDNLQTTPLEKNLWLMKQIHWLYR